MNTIFVVCLILVVFIVFFAWASNQAKAKHAKFDKSDVLSALKNLIADDSTNNHDEFDMFISWPINDSYLESIRKRTREIIAKYKPTANCAIPAAGIREIEELMIEVQNHA